MMLQTKAHTQILDLLLPKAKGSKYFSCIDVVYKNPENYNSRVPGIRSILTTRSMQAMYFVCHTVLCHEVGTKNDKPAEAAQREDMARTSVHTLSTSRCAKAIARLEDTSYRFRAETQSLKMRPICICVRSTQSAYDKDLEKVP